MAPSAISSRMRRSCGRSASPGEATSESPRARASSDEVVGLVDGRRERLVDVHVLARLEREPRVRVVQADRRRDGDGVDAALGQQRLEIGERVRDAEALGGGGRAAGHRIADRMHDHAVLDVRLCQVRQQSAQRDRARADDAEAKGGGARHGRSSSSSATSTARPSAAERRAASITASTWIARPAESDASPPPSTVSTSCSTPSR